MIELRVLEPGIVAEASRQFDICNACRYCEGLCAVFPALERRSFFTEGDITYLASLCHDCRSCYHVCPYAPPHEFAVDVPTLMSSVRERTYAGYGWPRWLAARVDRRLSYALGLSTATVVAVVVATIFGSGLDRVFAVHSGPGSFYAVVPWLAMMLPAMVISLYAVAVMLVGGLRYWRDTGRSSVPLTSGSAVIGAIWDAMTLRFLRGGGPGCAYPDERPSRQRLLYHSLVFYGFIAAFISTTLAAIYQDIFGLLPPYDLTSLPVLFGSVGGIAMIIGCVALLILKRQAGADRSNPKSQTMDVSFLVVLLLVNVTGMMLLALRGTAAMGMMLALHLGFVAALFLTLPYGKFVHGVYRGLALLRNRVEAP